MMMLDEKRAVGAIMKRRKQAGAGQEADKNITLTKPTDGELDPRHMAAEDVMNAFHSRNVHHLKEALGNFHDLHKMHNEEEDRKSGPHDSNDFDMESDLAEL